MVSAKKTVEVQFDARKLTELLTKGGPKAAKALEQSLYREAAAVFTQSQVEVPVDTGNLRNSGKLGLPFSESGQVVVEISYGGAAADYGIYVHEDLEARHNPGTNAKFLEGPLKRQTKGMATRLTASVARALGI